MSDAACLECDNECPFRDYSYNCHVRECQEIQNLVTADQREHLKVAWNIAEKLEKQQAGEDFQQLRLILQEIFEKLSANVEGII